MRTRRASIATAIGFISTAMISASVAGAQLSPVEQLADSLRRTIEASVDASDVKGIDQAIVLSTRALAAFHDDALLLHYRAYAYYRAGTITMGQLGASAARPYFLSAREILELLVKRTTIAESYALLASVYGMQIAVSRVQMIAGMQLGPKSKQWMERAVQAAPGNPRVLLMQGIGDYNTPSTFGGGLDKAEAHLKKALVLFAEDHPAPPFPSWGVADAHVWLGQLYAKEKKTDLARAEYAKVLQLQPGNAWVVRVLLPALDHSQK